MAGIAVSVSMGVMKPLLDKLATLMGDEYKKIKGLRKEVSFLEGELRYMSALLEKMDDADELDALPKTWRKDIIEMSYDIEDYIDDFMARVGESGDNVGVLQKASHYLRTFKDRRRMANSFQEIKRQVIEAGERRKRYMLDQCVPTTTATVVVDPRLSARYKNSANLVGIDSQKEEIAKWVMDDEGTQLKVMSIVGFGGLGKTTLANEVYREIGGKFDCKAFVSVSQKPDIIKLLNSITLQLGLQPYSYPCQLEDHINNIKQCLQDKRYLIVIDDLWDIQAWNPISCAFQRNNHRGRVMITTRNNDVARVSCGQHGFIHRMKPLSEEDSRKLFFDRICEFEDPCPSDIMEASCNILKKCGGLPLAIITMASMIACDPTRSKRQWAKYIQNSLGVEFANRSYEDMMRIIDFSYKNLPRHLKACFLYLGIYPEDHGISRVDLVRRWVAEGFINCSHGGKDIWDVAESYFNELVNRSMIQPVYKGSDPIVAKCRVHDMILELILRKCSEDNFISLTVDSPDRMLGGQYKFIRRLTFHGGRRRIEDTMQLSHLRSLNIFSGKYWIPNLAEFKFIRVLFLCNIAVDIDLSGINQLSQLRYLRIDGYCNKMLLPAQIRGLRLLETLNLSGTVWVPEIVDAPRLSHVSVAYNRDARLPNKIGTMKSLLSVTGFNLEMSSLESIAGLGELTALSKLTLYAHRIGSHELVVPSKMMTLIAALITSLENLHNLKYLYLCSSITYCGDAMLASSYSPAFRNIECLDLRLVIFSSVPTWIGHLCCLRLLDLTAKQIHQEDFNMIGTRLASLSMLILHITQVPTNRIVIEGSTGFKVLKSFKFDCDGWTTCLTFEADAMPDLQMLRLMFDPLGWDETSPLGLQHLPSLKIIRLFPAKPYTSMNHFDVTEDEEMRAIKTARVWDVFERIANALPTRPRVLGEKHSCWQRPKVMVCACD